MFVKKSFLLMIVIFLSCHSKNKTQPSAPKKDNNKQPVELKVKFISWLNDSHQKGMVFKTALVNNTAYPLGYMNMSCSYSEAFCTDLPGIRPQVQECNKNIPTFYSIGFQDMVTRDVILIFRDNKIPVSPARFRIGFHFVKADYFTDADPFKELKDSANIIWSNPVQL